MIDPYQEIFEKIIELSNESGYATFDYLPDESQAYPLFTSVISKISIESLRLDF